MSQPVEPCYSLVPYIDLETYVQKDQHLLPAEITRAKVHVRIDSFVPSFLLTQEQQSKELAYFQLVDGARRKNHQWAQAYEKDIQLKVQSDQKAAKEAADKVEQLKEIIKALKDTLSEMMAKDSQDDLALFHGSLCLQAQVLDCVLAKRGAKDQAVFICANTTVFISINKSFIEDFVHQFGKRGDSSQVQGLLSNVTFHSDERLYIRRLGEFRSIPHMDPNQCDQNFADFLILVSNRIVRLSQIVAAAFDPKFN